MKFSITTLLAYVISLSVLMLGSLETVGTFNLTKLLPDFMQIEFLSIPSLFVVLGGVMTGLFVMYPTATVLTAVGTLRHVFSHFNSKSDLVEKQIEQILKYRAEYAADKNGFFLRTKPSDPTTRYMFDLVSTNYSTREMQDMADMYLDKRLTMEIQKNGREEISYPNFRNKKFAQIFKIAHFLNILSPRRNFSLFFMSS